MHRDVRRIGDQIALAVEDGAGKIEPLLDVDRGGGVLQRHPHLLGDRHEQVGHHLEQDRIDLGAGLRRGAGLGAGEDEVAVRVHLGPPARLDDGGGGGIDDQRRAGRSCRRSWRSARS